MTDELQLPEWFDPDAPDAAQAARLMAWCLDTAVVLFVRAETVNEFFLLHGITCECAAPHTAWMLLIMRALVLKHKQEQAVAPPPPFTETNVMFPHSQPRFCSRRVVVSPVDAVPRLSGWPPHGSRLYLDSAGDLHDTGVSAHDAAGGGLLGGAAAGRSAVGAHLQGDG